jgi:hypothetical protein
MILTGSISADSSKNQNLYRMYKIYGAHPRTLKRRAEKESIKRQKKFVTDLQAVESEKRPRSLEQSEYTQPSVYKQWDSACLDI